MRAGLAASTVTPGSTAPDVSLTTPETLAALVPCANVAVGVSKAPIATQTATPTLAIRVIFRLLATVSGSDTQTGMRQTALGQNRTRHVLFSNPPDAAATGIADPSAP